MKQLFRRDLNLIWWINIAVMVCYTINGALLPLLMRERGFGEGSIGFALGMISTGSMVGYLISGRAIDRLDRRLFILAGGLLWAIASVWIYFAQSVALIAFIRLLQGIAFSILYTSSIVYASQALPKEWRGRMIGLIEAVGAIAIAVTPILAYWLSDHWGYLTVLLVAGGVGLLTGLPALLLSHQITQPPTRESASHLSPSMIIEPRAIVLGLSAACLFFCATSFVVLSPLIAIKINITQIGLFLGLRALGTVPARLLAGVISDRFSPTYAVVPGFILSVLAIGLITIVKSESAGLALAFLFGFGMGLVSPALSARLLNLVPVERQGIALNTLYMFSEAAGFLGSWVLGVVLEFAGLITGMLLLCATLLLGLTIYLMMRSRQPQVQGTFCPEINNLPTT